MGKTVKQNRTTFIRCPKNKQYPFNRLPAKLYTLNGYQFAIMAYILSNRDNWNLVKYEIGKRLGFPRDKFNKAWKSLEDLGYIKKTQIQGGWEYTIKEDLDFTPTTDSNREGFTLTTGSKCKDGILTTTKNNYNYYNNTTGTVATCYEEQFSELESHYPASSNWPNGQTVPLKRNLLECEKLYKELLKTAAVSHEEIMRCLNVELEERRQNGTMHYQMALLRWIKEEGWKPYVGKTFEPVESVYGTEII